jgi:hypothetical protein
MHSTSDQDYGMEGKEADTNKHQNAQQYNPLLAAHLGLGSDDVEGPLALLAGSEVHPHDNNRFKNILAKAKHKETGKKDAGKTKTTSKKSTKIPAIPSPRPLKKKVPKAPSKSKAKAKAKTASVPGSTYPAENESLFIQAPDAAEESIARDTLRTMQDWKRTKAATKLAPGEASSKDATSKHASHKSSAAELLRSNTDDMEDPELAQSVVELMETAAERAKSKLDTFRWASTFTTDNTAAPGDTRDLNQVSGPGWLAPNDELPTSVYHEEDLFDNGLFPHEAPPEGDIPDPDYGVSLNFDAGEGQIENSTLPTHDTAAEVTLASDDMIEVIGGLQEADLLDFEIEWVSDIPSTSLYHVDHDEPVDLMDADLDDDVLNDLVQDLDELADEVGESIDAEMQDPGGVQDRLAEYKVKIPKDVVMSDFSSEEEDDWNMDLDMTEPYPKTSAIPEVIPAGARIGKQDKHLVSIIVPQSAAPSPPLHITPPPSSKDIIVFDSSQPAPAASTPPQPSNPPPIRNSRFTFNSTTLPFLSPTPPIARSPFSAPCLDRSPIIGLTPSTLLRTCFRVGEALRVGTASARENRVVIVELFARVLWSVRDTERGVQTFEFGDLFHERKPWLRGHYEGWAGKEPWAYDAGLLVTGREEREGQVENKKMARVLGRVERDELTKGWRMKVMNVWMCEWEDVEAVRRIYY